MSKKLTLLALSGFALFASAAAFGTLPTTGSPLPDPSAITKPQGDWPPPDCTLVPPSCVTAPAPQL